MTPVEQKEATSDGAARSVATVLVLQRPGSFSIACNGDHVNKKKSQPQKTLRLTPHACLSRANTIPSSAHGHSMCPSLPGLHSPDSCGADASSLRPSVVRTELLCLATKSAAFVSFPKATSTKLCFAFDEDCPATMTGFHGCSRPLTGYLLWSREMLPGLKRKERALHGKLRGCLTRVTVPQQAVTCTRARLVGSAQSCPAWWITPVLRFGTLCLVTRLCFSYPKHAYIT